MREYKSDTFADKPMKFQTNDLSRKHLAFLLAQYFALRVDYFPYSGPDGFTVATKDGREYDFKLISLAQPASALAAGDTQ